MIDSGQILSTFTANIKSEALQSFLDDADEVIIEALSEAFERQGHTLTGKLISDIETDVTINRGGFVIDYLSHKYGAYLNFGVKANKIPYARGSGAGHSLYIQGLMKYVSLRMGLSGREQKSAAFAIAEAQKKKGMQIKNLGQGSKWADEASDDAGKSLLPLFEHLAETYVTQGLTELAKRYGNNS